MPCPLAAGGSLELGRQVAARAVGEEGEPRSGTAASGRHQLSGSLSHVAQGRQGHGPAGRGFHFQIWMRTCPIPRIHARAHDPRDSIPSPTPRAGHRTEMGSARRARHLVAPPIICSLTFPLSSSTSSSSTIIEFTSSSSYKNGWKKEIENN